MYHILPESKGDVVGIRIEGYVRAEDYKTLLPFLEERIIQHGMIRVLLDLRDFKSIKLSGLVYFLPFALKYSSHIERKAIITDQHWIYAWMKFLAPFFKAQIRCFASTNLEKAWEWVSA